MSLKLHIEDIMFVESLIAGCGLESRDVMTELGLPIDLFNLPNQQQIDLSDYVRILRYLVEASGDETCTGSARQILVGTTPFLLGGVQKDTVLGDVFRRLADGYNFAHGAAYNRVRESQNRLSYIVDDTGFPYTNDDLKRYRHAFVESILISLHGLFCELSGTPLDGRVVKVTTKRQRTESGGSFLKFWRAPVQFGAENYSIQYDGRIAELPVTAISRDAYTSIFDAASNIALSRVGRLSSDGSWTEKVRRVIASGMNDQAAVSLSLGISPATLRRRLANEGVSFRLIRASTLNARAQRMLERGEPVDLVAETLGFSDLRSFSRAFKAWNSQTPNLFQRGAAAGGRPA